MKMHKYFKSNNKDSDFSELIEEVNALIIASSLSGSEIDTLLAAYDYGLLDSGNTPSKSGRDSLLAKGILCQTCHKDSDFTFSVTYPLGLKVSRALSVISDIRDAK